ncbi:YcaO-like family protein [Mycobacterium heidelbergense]|uniref:YcaO-like family protein n=1 Tax=Mycobacterium heidelbergense TaxID=53376 RepID=UPI003CEC40E3
MRGNNHGGDPDESRAGSAPKRHRLGTHRTCSPVETVAAVRPRMAELGITRIADVTGLDRIGLPVFMAVRPNSRAISVAQGKGVTRDAAVASALMEAVEGWHCERVDVALAYDSYAALRRRARTVDPMRLPVRRGAVFQPSYPLLWAEAAELITGEPIWIPFECVSTNFVEPNRAGETFIASTNGLASGNHRLEAIVHGLCELIERDSYALWLARGGSDQAGTRVDLTTVHDGAVQGLLSQLSDAGVLLAVWELTADTGVPAFYCQLVDHPNTPRWAHLGVSAGMGCHLDAVVALLRAVTEAVQSRLTSISGSRDDMFHYDTQANLDDVRATAELFQRPADRAFTRVDLSTETFKDDVAWLGAALAQIGLDSVAVVDLTRPDIGIPVVKVVVAGLETNPEDDHYAPGERAIAAAGSPT